MDMKLSDNFSIEEFACKCGAPVPLQYRNNVVLLAFMLQRIRDQIKAPIIITSGYRTIAWNEANNGSKNSYHLTAQAVDFYAPGISIMHLKAEIIRLMLKGLILQGGFGIYPTFIHLDTRRELNIFKT